MHYTMREKNNSRVDALEYGLLACFVSVLLIAGLVIATPAMSLIYSMIGYDLSTACANMGGYGC